jgi:hypothetical protein
VDLYPVPSDPLQLDYAPPPARHRQRVRRALLLVLVIAVLWTLAEHGPDTARRLRLLWVQGRCARFEFPAGTVIFDSDRAARAPLLANAEDYVALDDAQVWPVTGVARREPACWVSLKDILFAGRTFWPPGPPAPKVMVHLLTTADGKQQRLVAIIFAPAAPLPPTASPIYPTPGIGLVAAIVQPGTWDTPPRWDGNSEFLRANFETAKHLKFFAAQLDPKDPSRFTVRYEMDHQPGTVDGNLEDDGTVSLKIRDGPAKTN